MNIFRLIADFLHLASFAIIIYKLHKHKNCSGNSIIKINDRCFCKDSRDLPYCIFNKIYGFIYVLHLIL